MKLLPLIISLLSIVLACWSLNLNDALEKRIAEMEVIPKLDAAATKNALRDLNLAVGAMSKDHQGRGSMLLKLIEDIALLQIVSERLEKSVKGIREDIGGSVVFKGTRADFRKDIDDADQRLRDLESEQTRRWRERR